MTARRMAKGADPCMRTVEPRPRQVGTCGVHFSTALHIANQCSAAMLNETHIGRQVESSGDTL